MNINLCRQRHIQIFKDHVLRIVYQNFQFSLSCPFLKMEAGWMGVKEKSQLNCFNRREIKDIPPMHDANRKEAVQP